MLRTMKFLPTVAASAALLTGAALSTAATAHAQSRPIVLAVEGRASANPTVASNGAFVAVAFSAASASSMDIYVAVSADGGTTFGAPTQVNAVAGEARVSGEEPPRIALVPRRNAPPEIVVVWTAKAGPTWKLLRARSLDGGKSFGKTEAVPGSEGDGSRGWESMAVDGSGKVSVLWLDHRDLVAADAKMKHDMGPNAAPMPKADPTERAGLSQLFFASLDGNKATPITRSVCYGCKTSLVASGKNLYAVWRHVYPGGFRDMAFTASRDGGKTFSTPVRVSEDHWQIDGCPDNGPAIGVDARQRAHVVWPTSQDGKNNGALGIFYAISNDGKAFAPRVQVPSRGPASHPQIVVNADGSSVIVWDEIVDGTRRLGITKARTDAAGKVTFVPTAAPDAGPGQWYPAIASTANGAVVTWVRQQEKGSVVAVSVVR